MGIVVDFAARSIEFGFWGLGRITNVTEITIGFEGNHSNGWTSQNIDGFIDRVTGIVDALLTERLEGHPEERVSPMKYSALQPNAAGVLKAGGMDRTTQNAIAKT